MWIGFPDHDKTSFYNPVANLASGLVGMKQGAKLQFLDAGSASQPVGRVSVIFTNPIGSPTDYRNLKAENPYTVISTAGSGSPSLVDVLRICPATARSRVVRLYSDSPVDVRSEVGNYTTSELRETWFAKAEIAGRCSDGAVATFRFGPTDAKNGKQGHSPVRAYFDRWFNNAWKDIPVGVQVK